jgi:CubicO group peptidase (beta-lactamase class C family)
MTALDLAGGWEAGFVSAAAVSSAGVVDTWGDTSRTVRIASVGKLLVTYAGLISVEEGSLSLDEPAGPPGATVRHLLAHAAGYSFDQPEPVSRVGARRIYSNTGIERFADHLGRRTGIDFGTYLHDAVLVPLGMTSTELRGSPAHAVWSNVSDLARFAGELFHPTLITAASLAEATSSQFPSLAGVLPGIGRQDPCDWGLGFEIKGHKQPHWTGRSNSPQTYGHFGGSGTFLWLDPINQLSLICLTDRAFGPWALRAWPELSDAVLAG